MGCNLGVVALLSRYWKCGNVLHKSYLINSIIFEGLNNCCIFIFASILTCEFVCMRTLAEVVTVMMFFQACISANRVLVQEGVHDQFLAALKEAVKQQTVVGDGMKDGVTVGPLINATQLKRVRM